MRLEPRPAGLGMAVISVPFALDYGAVMMMGAALGCDQQLLAEVLPAVECAIVAGLSGDDGEEEEV